MEKIIHLSRLEARWLSTRALLVVLFTVCLPLFQAQAQTYCTPVYTIGCSSGDNLNSVVITGHGTSSISDLNTGCNGGGYADRTSLFAPVDLLPGQSYTVEMNTTYASPTSERASIWIDFDNNGVFDATEKLLTDLPLALSPAFVTATIDIPLTATPGIRRMRIRVIWSTTGVDACASASYGEVHDYAVNILSLVPCSGSVVAGVATASITAACAGDSFSLSLNGVTIGGGVTYQWQSSPQGAGTFTDIPGATSSSYNANQTAATDYRCIVTCTNSNSTATSTVVSVGQNPLTQCYCIPTYSYSCSNTSENVNSFILTGEGTSIISDLNTGCSTGNYQDRTSAFSPVDILQDGSYNVEINTNYSSGQFVWASLWIDFNDNGVFEASEQLIKDMPMATSPSFVSTSILIPDTALPGVHRMRVRANYNATVDACANGSWGETHDYEVNVIAITCYRPLDIEIIDITKNSAEVSVTGNPKNPSGVTYEYEVRESGAPGSGSTGLAVSGIATTNPFTVAGLQPSTKYTVYVKTICSSTDSSGWSKSEEISTLCNYPELITAPGKTVCGPQEVDLTAIFDAGVVYWYDAEEDGDLVHTGSNFTTPYLTTDTSYWVQAGDVPLDVTAEIGDGTATGTTATFLYHGWGGMKFQHIFTVDELSAAGLAAGEITGIEYDVVTAGTANRNNFSIALGTTTQNNATNVHIDNNNLTEVYSNASEVFAVGAKAFTFTTPYFWDGVSNLVVQVVWSNENTGGTSGAVMYHSTSPNMSTYTYADNRTAAEFLATNTGAVNGSGSTAARTERPNTVFFAKLGCSSPMVEVPVIIEPKPAFDLSSYKVTSCGGGASEVVTITTNLGGYDTFVWTPSTGVSGDAVNGWTFTTPQEQAYTLSASQSGGICEHIKTVWVFSGVGSVPNPNLAAVQDVCKNDITELNILEELPSNITFGTITTTTAANSGISAFVQSEEYSKQQYIYNASELIALGVDAAGFITGLDLNTINAGASFDNANYTIKMRAYNNTSFPDNNFVTGGFTTVYTREVHTHTFQGWQQFYFDNPFYWDGQSNIIIEITQEGIGEGLNLNNAQTYYTDVTGTNVGLYATDDTDPDPATGTMTTNRLDVRFSFEQSAVTWSPATNLFIDSAATIPYTGQSTLTVYHTSSQPSSQVYTASLTAPSECVTTKDYTINVIDVGTPVVASQSFCGSTPVSNIVVTGHQGAPLNFYNSATSTTPITTISQSGTYYVEAGQGDCISSRIAFTVSIVTLSNPTVTQFTQIICGSGTVADLKATGNNGAQIQWYSSPTSTTPLPSTQALVNNTTYYAAQTMSGCVSGRVAVLVNIGSAPAALTAQTINICGNLTYDGANLNQLGGAELVWYQSLTSQQPIPGTGQIVSGTYYVSQKVNGCESPRTQIIVSAQSGTVPAPTATTQNICGGGTVADLVAQTTTGGVAVWYNSSSSTTPLQSTDVLSSGTYYVAQQIGNCLSTKTAVSVRIISTTIPSVSPFNLCEGATVADLGMPTPTGTTYKWYINSTSTVPLDPTDVLSSGYYFVVRDQSGCESARVQVQVTIGSRPSSPTGASPQDFVNYAEIGELIMDQTNVVWYLTYDDAMNGVNPLPANMPLVHETTYYAVIIGSNGCPSLPTAVEVTVTLGVNDFDLTQLKYYPNPTSDLLTISYNEPIVKVEVFDLNGRMIMNRDFDKETVELDFSRLSSGTYMLNIKTKDSSQFVKIVRK